MIVFLLLVIIALLLLPYLRESQADWRVGVLVLIMLGLFLLPMCVPH